MALKADTIIGYKSNPKKHFIYVMKIKNKVLKGTGADLGAFRVFDDSIW